MGKKLLVAGIAIITLFGCATPIRPWMSGNPIATVIHLSKDSQIISIDGERYYLMDDVVVMPRSAWEDIATTIHAAAEVVELYNKWLELWEEYFREEDSLQEELTSPEQTQVF